MPPSGAGLRHLQAEYAAVVTHPELEAEALLRPTYTKVLGRSLGEPSVQAEGVVMWRLGAPGGPGRE